MKKITKVFALLTALCMLLSLGVFASGETAPAETSHTPGSEAVVPENDGEPRVSSEEPGEENAPAHGESHEDGEASGEPGDKASGEASKEHGKKSSSFEVTISVDGKKVRTASVETTVDGNVYTFDLSELLEELGVTMTYDEETDVVSLKAIHDDGASGEPSGEMEEETSAEPSGEMEEETSAEPSGEMEEETSAEPSGEMEEETSAEPSGETEEEASAEPSEEIEEEASAEPAEGASGEASGEASAEPATEEEFEAYVTYIRAYMAAYAGVGDGTFDDGARTMALGELDTVAFGDDVTAFPFEMFVSQFGALDYGGFLLQQSVIMSPASE